MATQLQRQLAAIAAKSTHELDLQAQKSAHSKSLLFEPTEAGRQSFDKLYRICFEGFEELCLLDSRFHQFASSLFSTQSQEEDRVRMTQQENDDLDKVISRFFTLVSSRILLNPAQKAIEWIIRRFRAHEYNVSQLVLSFLPYHSLPIFATLLSILPKTLPVAFRFLHPYVGSLSCPPRRAIVQATVQQQAFLTAYTRFTLDSAKRQHVGSDLLKQWAGVLTEALKRLIDSSRSGRQSIQQQRQEDILTRIFPIVNEALSIRGIPDLQIAVYTLLVVLCYEISLNDEALDALLVLVAGSLSATSQPQCISCLAIIASRKLSTNIPKSVMRRLAKIDHLAAQIDEISLKQPVDKFIQSLVLTATTRLEKENSIGYIQLIESLVKCNSFKSLDESSILGIQAAIQGKAKDLEVSGEQDPSLQLLELVRSEHFTMTESSAEPEGDSMEAAAAAEDDDKHLPIRIRGNAGQSSVQDFENSWMGRKYDCSFLTAEADDQFLPLMIAFESAVREGSSQRSKIEALLAAAASTEPLPPITFLARVWSSGASRSASFRIAASRVAANIVGKKIYQPIDYLALLPYLMSGLADSSSIVRREIARFVRILHQSHSSPSGSDAVIKPVLTLDYEKIHGSQLASSPSMLDVEELNKFIEQSILPSLEECISDADYIFRLVYTVLDDSSKAKARAKDGGIQRPKSDLRSKIYSYLCRAIVGTPIYMVQLRLLKMLTQIDKAGELGRFQALKEYRLKATSLSAHTLSSACSLEKIDLVDFERTLTATAQPSDKGSIYELLDLICNGSNPSTETHGISSREELKIAAFYRIERLWPDIKPNLQTQVAHHLLEMSLDTLRYSYSTVRSALATLRTISIDSPLFTQMIEAALNAERIETNGPFQKKQRIENGAVSRGSLLDRWEAVSKRLGLILELREQSTATYDLDLFRSLFDVLGLLQQRELRDSPGTSYLRSLTVSNLSSAQKSLDKQRLLRASEITSQRTDLLVACIQTTSDSATRNAALHLLGQVVKFAPQNTLQSVMPIFTLMSTTTATQSDNYSAHVVDQTIEQVVSLLAKQLRESRKDLIHATSEILLSFSAAYEHIPLGRRLRLFTLLANSLGPGDSLFAIVATLCAKSSPTEDTQRFSVKLMEQFNNVDALTSVQKYLDLILDAFLPRPRLYSVLIRHGNGKDVKANMIRSLLTVVPKVFKSKTLWSQVHGQLRSETPEAEQLRALLGQILVQVTQVSQKLRDDQQSIAPCPEILQSILQLLPLDQLAQTTAMLFDRVDVETLRKLINTLKLQVLAQSGISELEISKLIEVLPLLASTAIQSENKQTRYAALACVDQLLERIGKTDRTAVSQTIQSIVSSKSLEDTDATVRMLSLHCLATSVDVLENEFIPFLTATAPSALKALSPDPSSVELKLCYAAYTYFISLADKLAFMLSKSELVPLFKALCNMAGKQDGEATESSKHLQKILATKVPVAVLIETFDVVFRDSTTLDVPALNLLLETIQTTIQNNSRSVISRNSDAFSSLFTALLDIPRLRSEYVKDEEINRDSEKKIEQDVIETLLSFIYKINDTIFRPYFHSLVVWATESLPPSDHKGRVKRTATLFHFYTVLSDKLKSLVTNYAAFIVDVATSLLQTSSSKSFKRHEPARLAAMQALSSSFQHDQDEFWTSPSHFEPVFLALISQLSIPQLPANYQRQVISTITDLATAASAISHHKEMNSAILKLARSEKRSVRLACVKCQQELTTKLGDEWLSHLPEMLPVIGELQEDQEEDIENETIRWIKSIEEILGESLDAMLS